MSKRKEIKRIKAEIKNFKEFLKIDGTGKKARKSAKIMVKILKNDLDNLKQYKALRNL